MKRTPGERKARQAHEKIRNKQLKELFSSLVDHAYGHHETITGILKKLGEFEHRIARLEKKV